MPPRDLEARQTVIVKRVDDPVAFGLHHPLALGVDQAIGIAAALRRRHVMAPEGFGIAERGLDHPLALPVHKADQAPSFLGSEFVSRGPGQADIAQVAQIVVLLVAGERTRLVHETPATLHQLDRRHAVAVGPAVLEPGFRQYLAGGAHETPEAVLAKPCHAVAGGIARVFILRRHPPGPRIVNEPPAPVRGLCRTGPHAIHRRSRKTAHAQEAHVGAQQTTLCIDQQADR